MNLRLLNGGSQAERARYKACVRKAIKCGSWPAFYKKHHADYDFLYSHNLLIQFYKDTGFTAKHSKNAIIASDVKLTDLFELAQNYDSYKDWKHVIKSNPEEHPNADIVYVNNYTGMASKASLVHSLGL